MAEEPARYCGNCGNELSPEDQFCQNCGTPVHRAARVPTPEADVPDPPPPGQQAESTTTAPPPQAEAPPRRSTANKLLVAGCIGIVLLVVLVVVVFGVALVASSGGGGSGPAGSRSAERNQEREFMSGSAPAPKDIRKCAVGQPCKMGTSTLTVTDVRMDDIVPITFDKPLTAGPYVFVDYSYTYGDMVRSCGFEISWSTRCTFP